MTESSKERRWADWLAAQTMDRFQEKLNAATEDDQYKILAQLLSDELERLKTN